MFITSCLKVVINYLVLDGIRHLRVRAEGGLEGGGRSSQEATSLNFIIVSVCSSIKQWLWSLTLKYFVQWLKQFNRFGFKISWRIRIWIKAESQFIMHHSPVQQMNRLIWSLRLSWVKICLGFYCDLWFLVSSNIYLSAFPISNYLYLNY